MNSERRTELLKDFFRTYFHEDWNLDSDNTDAVIGSYNKNSTFANRKELSEAIVNFVQNFTDDAPLESVLLTKLRCYYRPSLDGVSAREWLYEVASKLLAH
jgi:CdiI immunity protein